MSRKSKKKLENDVVNEEQVEPDTAETADSADTEQQDSVEKPEPATEPELSLEEQLTLERDVFHDKWMRAVAETDNVRKRSRKEIADARRFAQADTLRPFLEVYDNFQRALQNNAEADSFREGVELIFQKFEGVLRDRGLSVIPTEGCEFDPNVHEAVGQLPREGVEPGQVIEVAQQGFKFQDMVLRPARVIVSS